MGAEQSTPSTTAVPVVSAADSAHESAPTSSGYAISGDFLNADSTGSKQNEGEQCKCSKSCWHDSEWFIFLACIVIIDLDY